jgi:hypothetical protein
MFDKQWSSGVESRALQAVKSQVVGTQWEIRAMMLYLVAHEENA